MLSQSDETIAAWKATERTLAVRVTIAGKEYTATDINSLKYDAGAYTGETFAIGSTYSNNVQIEFSHLVEGLNLGDEVQVSVGINVSGNYVYEPLGVFIISSEIKMDRNNNLTTISASDAFCKLEGLYKSKLIYPAKVLDVISEICAMAGAEPNTSELSRLPKLADIPTAIEGQSYRKALGWIAQLYAGYATFDRSGKLTIRTVAEPSYELDPSQYEQSGLTKNEATYKISGIQCQVTTKSTTRDDQVQETTTTLQVGSTSGSQIKLENNIMTPERLDYIWEKLKDINFYPFSLNWFGNPAVEAGDWLRLYDKKGNDFVVPNNGYTLEFNGGLSAVSKADQTSGSAQTISWSGSIMQIIKDLQHRNAPDGTVIFPTSISEPPENAHFNDVWFKKNGNDTELWIFERQDNGTGEWQRNDIVNDEIKEEIKRQQAELDELSKNFDDSTGSFQQSLSGIYDAVENAKINTDKAVQQALDQAQKASNDLLNYASEFDSEINLLNEAKDKNKADINKLLTDVNGVKGMYADLEGNISNFNAGLNGLSGQLKDTKNQLASVKLTADGAVSNFANLQGDIASLKTRANGIEQQMLSKVGTDIFESFKSSTAQELKEKLTATDLNGYVKTAELTRTADGLHASITAVDGKLNSLSFGGRNLLKQSQLGAKFPHDAWYEAFGGVTWNDDTVELDIGNKDCVQIEQRVYDIEPDTDYVFSFDLNWADGQHLDKQGFIFWEFQDREGKHTTRVYRDNWTSMAKLPNTPGRKDKKIVIHTQPDAHMLIFMVRSLKGAIEPFRISKVKLEKGNVATDWSPAPEDIDNEFTTVNNTLKANKVTLDVLQNGISLNAAETSKINDKISNLGVQNLVYNSEFINDAEGWSNIGNNPAGTILFADNEWDSWQGSNGLAFRNSSAPTSTLLSQSKRFKVLNWQRISASVQLHVTATITNSCDAGMEIVFYPDETSGNEIKRVSQTTSRVNNISNGFAKLLYVNDVEVPSNAKFATLRLWTYKVGNVIFNQPMVTFSSSYLPYTQDNKSLGVLSEKYAALDVKVNGINSTVANKADVSYVDQRAGQWQAKLEELQVGGTNLLYNTREYQGWDLYNCSVEDDNGAKTRIIHYWFGAGQQNAKDSVFRAKNSIYLVKGQQYTISCKAKYYSSNPTGREVGGQSLRMFSSYTDQHGGGGFLLTETLRDQWKKYSCTFTSDRTGSFDGWRIINWINGRFEGGSIYVAEIKIEEGSRATDWSPAPEDNMAAITAVRNELNTAINLRVQKGELLSQINMQAGHTLIQANKIYLDAESVVFSGKAFIPSAAIASLSADKINGGTINGRTVNVTNLNANNITSGTINGQNLSINLDNGIVQFQRGKIAKTDNSFVINIETGEISSNSNTGAKLYVNRGSLETVNSNNEGIFLSNGALELSSKSLSSASKKYGSISINNHLFEDGYGGIDILGNKAFSIRTEGFLASHLLIGVKYQEVKGAGIIGGLGELQLASEKSIELFAGKASGQDKAEFRPSISIGTTQNGSLSDSIYRAGQNVFIQGQTVALKAQKEINMVAQADTEINIGSPYVGTNAKTIRIGNQYMYQNNELMISWDRVGIGTYPYYYPEPKPDNGLYQGLSKGGSYVNMKKDGNMFVMSDHALILSGGNQGASTQFLDLKSYYPHISIGAYDWAENYTQPMQSSSINIVGWNVDLFAFHEDINLKTFPDHGVHVMGGGMTIDNGLQVHDLHVLGWLGVDGSKNSIVDTSQGKTAINAYETAEYYFGDIAKANTGTSKRVKIMIDPLFLETINTDIDYHVFVSSYSNGYAWVSEMARDYFVIESNVPDLSVSYEIKAKRKQYENVRLDKVDVNLIGGTK
ncbi:hypothetical protein HCG60_06415 [Ligilactobacillus murinus]|uniref:carbohydrate binding domain-containing protein n=1 Tax=Ligilactobacillus murinus TaxID=1622 RepID=UPI001C8B34E2|nr:carbohydrate binding domain-containing protein [Ligilactobacillus murinus]MBX9012665.1 hypothetical protein [Ligilactobacillus murinus]